MEAPNLDVVFKLFEHVQFGRIFFLIAGIGLLVYAVRLLYRATDKLSSRFPAKRLLFLQVAPPLSFFMYVFGFAYLFFSVLQPPKELLLALGGGAATIFYGCGVVIFFFVVWYFDSGLRSTY